MQGTERKFRSPVIESEEDGPDPTTSCWENNFKEQTKNMFEFSNTGRDFSQWSYKTNYPSNSTEFLGHKQLSHHWLDPAEHQSLRKTVLTFNARTVSLNLQLPLETFLEKIIKTHRSHYKRSGSSLFKKNLKKDALQSVNQINQKRLK